MLTIHDLYEHITYLSFFFWLAHDYFVSELIQTKRTLVRRGRNVNVHDTLQTKNPDIFPVYSKRLEYAGSMSQLANSTLEVG